MNKKNMKIIKHINILYIYKNEEDLKGSFFLAFERDKERS